MERHRRNLWSTRATLNKGASRRSLVWRVARLPLLSAWIAMAGDLPSYSRKTFVPSCFDNRPWLSEVLNEWVSPCKETNYGFGWRVSANHSWTSGIKPKSTIAAYRHSTGYDLGNRNDRVRLGVERAKVLARALKCHPGVLVFPGWELPNEAAA